GRSSGCFSCGCGTHAHVVTSPLGPTSTRSSGVSSSPVSGSYSVGGQITWPSLARMPRNRRARRPAMNRPMIGPPGRAYGDSMMLGASRTSGSDTGQMRTRSRGGSQTAVDSRVMTLQPDPREVYAFMDPVEDLARARKHELVREVKRLVDLTAHIDVERADRDELAQLADDAAELADRLEPLPSLLEVGGMAPADGPQAAPLERHG